MRKIGLIFFLFIPLAYAINTPSSTTIAEKTCILNASPPSIFLYIPPNSTQASSFFVKAEYPGNLGLNVTLNKTGEIKDWISLEKEKVELAPGETKEVKFNVTSNSSLGLFKGGINLTADEQNFFINLTINVTENVGRVNVSVRDIVGNLVEGASIFLWMNSYLKDSGSTDELGIWVSKWQVEGNYSIEVAKAGYLTKTQNVTILAGKTVSVSIILEPRGAPILDVSPSFISESAYVGDKITKILIISNKGDMVLDDIEIFSDVAWIAFNQDFIDYLQPGESQLIYAYLLANSPGTFSGNIFVNSANDGNLTIPVILQVASRLPISFPSISLPSYPVKKEKGIEIVEYPREINVSQGEVKLFSVKVRNNGTESLDAKILFETSFRTKISPLSLKLLPNSSQVFLIELRIPSNARLGEHRLTLKAVGDGCFDERIIKVNVFPRREEKDELKNEITELRKLIEKIWLEALEAGTKGYNITKVLDFLNKSKASVELSESFLESDDIENSKKYLEEGRIYLEKAVVELSRIKSVELKIKYVPFEFYILIFILLSSLGILAFITFLLKIRYERKIRLLSFFKKNGRNKEQTFRAGEKTRKIKRKI